MPILSLSIEYGAQHKAFASGVARVLGSELANYSAFERDMARRLDCGEGPFAWDWCGFAARWPMTRENAVTRYTELILAAAAGDDIVIHGCCAPLALGGIAGVVKILIRAPIESRALVVQRQLAYPDGQVARLEIEAEDAAMTRLSRYAFSGDWRDAHHYDLVIEADEAAGAMAMRLIKDVTRDPRYNSRQLVRASIEDRLSSLLSAEKCRDQPKPQTVRGHWPASFL